MSHMNYLNFPDYMFALSLLHTIEDNFGKRKQQKMKELGIPHEQMNLVLEKSASTHMDHAINFNTGLQSKVPIQYNRHMSTNVYKVYI